MDRLLFDGASIVLPSFLIHSPTLMCDFLRLSSPFLERGLDNGECQESSGWRVRIDVEQLGHKVRRGSLSKK